MEEEYVMLLPVLCWWWQQNYYKIEETFICLNQLGKLLNHTYELDLRQEENGKKGPSTFLEEVGWRQRHR